MLMQLDKIMSSNTLLVPFVHLLPVTVCIVLSFVTTIVAIDINEIAIDEILLPNDYFGGADHESYLSWYNEIESSYTGRMYLPADGTTTDTSNNGVAIHWKVDDIEELLYLAVAARAQDGWIAFGMAEAGGMKGADIVIYESSKPDSLTDAYVLSALVPLVDTCQDWELISAQNEGGFIIFEGVRKFDTKDPQDHIVFNDTETYIVSQKVIAAWGNDTDALQYHGKTNRARGALRWFGVEDELTAFRQRMATVATGYFDLSVTNYSIPAVETTYINFCFNWIPDIVPQGLPADSNVIMLSAEMIIDSIVGPLVHHTTLIAKPVAMNESHACDNPSEGNKQYWLYGWAFGGSPVEFPAEAGYTLGPQGGLQHFVFAVHYDNPRLIEGLTDNGSKFRIYYSITPRAYEMGIASFGDIFVSLRDQEISAGVSKYNFGCSDKCSRLILDEPITVVGEAFHMHSIASAAVQYQIRNGEVLRQANVNFFDFDQSGFHVVRQRPYQVFPGDAFSSTCIYETANGTTFGLASTQEMCEVFLFYYPAKTIFDRGQWSCGLGIPIAACNVTVDTSLYAISDESNIDFFERTFGASTSNQCFQKPTELTSGVIWSGKCCTVSFSYGIAVWIVTAFFL